MKTCTLEASDVSLYKKARKVPLLAWCHLPLWRAGFDRGTRYPPHVPRSPGTDCFLQGAQGASVPLAASVCFLSVRTAPAAALGRQNVLPFFPKYVILLCFSMT